MLPPDYLLNRIDEVNTLYSDFHMAILEDIARHIRDTLRATGTAGVIPSARYQVERLNQAGMVREDIIAQVATINRMSEVEISSMFEEAAVKAWAYDAAQYRKAGITPLPIKQSPQMTRILEAGVSKTLGSVRNMTGTTAFSGEQKFLDITNTAYNKTISGASSPQEALSDAMDTLAREGVTVLEMPSGRQISIEASARRSVLTGVNQTSGHIVHQGMMERGADFCRTSAHVGARNKGEGFKNHESWQGRVFSLKGGTDKYEDFFKACGYGDAQGIYGVNCRHSHGVYIEDLSPDVYPDAELDRMASETVTYNGEEIPFYDATQRLRYIERNVRKWKRKQKVKEAADLDSSIEKIKVREWQLKAKDFVGQTGLRRDYVRERIGT